MQGITGRSFLRSLPSSHRRSRDIPLAQRSISVNAYRELAFDRIRETRSQASNSNGEREMTWRSRMSMLTPSSQASNLIGDRVSSDAFSETQRSQPARLNQRATVDSTKHFGQKQREYVSAVPKSTGPQMVERRTPFPWCPQSEQQARKR
jgi:hypothetical protein